MVYTFLLEKLRTPIYQRIVNSFQAALVQQGQRVLLVDPADFASHRDYLNYLDEQAVDYCLIPNPRGLISRFIESEAAFVYELTSAKLIFVHHDNCFSDLQGFEEIRRSVQAFHNVRDRSWHFCLEYHNYLDLRGIGIERVYPISHASEFTRVVQPGPAVRELSFVGHVLPTLGSELEHMPYSHWLQADFWNRLVQFDHRMEKTAVQFAQKFKQQSEIEALTTKSFYISMLHTHSQFFRGEVIKRIEAGQVDIIGGDPAYLHGLDYNRRLEKPNVHYHPATKDYAAAQTIYAKSKINLNITSLQFDQAVINRVIDIGAAGGFVLTDWKADLARLTSVAREISYCSIEELNHKIEYYLHPDHEQERQEIAAALHQDLQRTCTYPAVVNYILSHLNKMPTDSPQPVRIDLGCGPWKAPGFIGVDVAPLPGVDVVADLSQRFPFADSTVDCVRAHDVIEHLADRIHTMNEIWRICKPDGLVDIRVPSTDGRGAFQDPTHISFWNVNSFKYYCHEFPNYLQLCQIYGFRGKFSLEHLSEEASEDGVVHVIAQLRAVKPRSAAEVKAAFKLREINWLVCPDWQQPEASLGQTLLNLLQAVLLHPQRSQITLLIDASGIDPEAADAALTSVLMYLMSEGIEIDEADETGAEISLLPQLNSQQWQELLPQLSARVRLDHETSADGIDDLPAVDLAVLSGESSTLAQEVSFQ